MKKFAISAFAILAVFLLVSCSTVVSVRNLVPANVNMSAMKNLAIASVVSADETPGRLFMLKTVHVGTGLDSTLKIFSGYRPRLADELAQYAQTFLVSKLSGTGYFNIISPSRTDELIAEGKMLGSVRGRFLDEGVDAILTSKVSVLSFNEFLSGEPRHAYGSEGKKEIVGVDFYLNTSVVLAFEYKIIGVAQNSIVYSKNMTRTVEDKRLAASYFYDNPSSPPAGKFKFEISSAPMLDSYYRSAILDMVSTLPKELAPSWEYSSETLMENTSKIESIEEGYKLADKGDYLKAFRIFDAQWKASGDLSSGYNAAILLYASGKLDEAIKYMEEVSQGTFSPASYAKLDELKEKQRLWNIAKMQVQGTLPEQGIEEFQLRYFYGL